MLRKKVKDIKVIGIYEINYKIVYEENKGFIDKGMLEMKEKKKKEL